MRQQLVLRPQDVVVCLSLCFGGNRGESYARLGQQLALSTGEVYAAVGRATVARLISRDSNGLLTAVKAALLEFVCHGVKYAFPPITGATVAGVQTASSGPTLRTILTQEAGDQFVWPFANGRDRGLALYPLYEKVPLAALRDARLYDALTMLDAIRVGGMRDRHIAEEKLAEAIQ